MGRVWGIMGRVQIGEGVCDGQIDPKELWVGMDGYPCLYWGWWRGGGNFD